VAGRGAGGAVRPLGAGTARADVGGDAVGVGAAGRATGAGPADVGGARRGRDGVAGSGAVAGPARREGRPAAGGGGAGRARRVQPAVGGTVAEPVGAAARRPGVGALAERVLSRRDVHAAPERARDRAGTAGPRAGGRAADVLGADS